MGNLASVGCMPFLHYLRIAAGNVLPNVRTGNCPYVISVPQTTLCLQKAYNTCLIGLLRIVNFGSKSEQESRAATAAHRAVSLRQATTWLSCFSKSHGPKPYKPVRKQNLTRNSDSMSFKVMHFGITEKPTMDCVSLYNKRIVHFGSKSEQESRAAHRAFPCDNMAFLFFKVARSEGIQTGAKTELNAK